MKILKIKSERYMDEALSVVNSYSVYDYESLFTVGLRHFKISRREVLSKKNSRKTKVRSLCSDISDVKKIYTYVLMYLPINYIAADVAQIFGVSANVINQRVSLFREDFLNDEVFRNKAIHFFNKCLTKQTRINIIKSFK